MAQRNVPHTTRVVTREGEVAITIVLELNINLNSNGVQVSAQTVHPTEPAEEKVEKVFEIPDFSTERIQFGKVEG